MSQWLNPQTVSSQRLPRLNQAPCYTEGTAFYIVLTIKSIIHDIEVVPDKDCRSNEMAHRVKGLARSDDIEFIP